MAPTRAAPSRVVGAASVKAAAHKGPREPPDKPAKVGARRVEPVPRQKAPRKVGVEGGRPVAVANTGAAGPSLAGVAVAETVTARGRAGAPPVGAG